MNKSRTLRQQAKPQIGASTSKDRTAPTPPLLSAGANVAQAEQSKQSRKAEPMPTYTKSTATQSTHTLTAAPTGTGSPPPTVTEEARRHADFARAAILQLEAAGLCKRQRRMGSDGVTVLAVLAVFDPSIWTDDLTLKV